MNEREDTAGVDACAGAGSDAGAAGAGSSADGDTAARALPSILHINTEPTWRGGESQAFQLMIGLAAAGHRVCAAALPGSEIAKRCRESGIAVFEVGMAGDLDLGAASRLARFARSRGFDILHAHTARAHAIGILARILGAPQRLVVHRRLDFAVSKNFMSRLKYRSRRVDLYLAVAGVIGDILAAAGVPRKRIKVVHSSIDLARFEEARARRAMIGAEVRRELGLPTGAPVIGNVAHLAGHKAQRDLVAAMPEILRGAPEAHLVIVGEGEERESLQDQTLALGLGERIHFAGFRKDVPRLLAAMDVFAMSSRLEGLCNSVLEAFAVGVPVIATRAGGLPEMVIDGDTGLLTPIGDPPALAAAALRLIRDRDLGARLAAAGRRLVEAEYTVPKMVERTRQAYADLMESPPD